MICKLKAWAYFYRVKNTRTLFSIAGSHKINPFVAFEDFTTCRVGMVCFPEQICRGKVNRCKCSVRTFLETVMKINTHVFSLKILLRPCAIKSMHSFPQCGQLQNSLQTQERVQFHFMHINVALSIVDFQHPESTHVLS